MVSGQLPLSDMSETNWTIGVPQLSNSSITSSGLGSGIASVHSSCNGGKFEAIGGVISSIIMVCCTVIMLPQESVTEYVLIIVSGQDSSSETSLSHAIIGGP